MVSAKCPECGESVRLPAADLPADASAECPWCGESISAARWMDTLPPVVKVIGADGQPIDFGPPQGPHAGSGFPVDPSTSGGSAGNPAEAAMAGFPGAGIESAQQVASDEIGGVDTGLLDTLPIDDGDLTAASERTAAVGGAVAVAGVAAGFRAGTSLGNDETDELDGSTESVLDEIEEVSSPSDGDAFISGLVSDVENVADDEARETVEEPTEWTDSEKDFEDDVDADEIDVDLFLKSPTEATPAETVDELDASTSPESDLEQTWEDARQLNRQTDDEAEPVDSSDFQFDEVDPAVDDTVDMDDSSGFQSDTLVAKPSLAEQEMFQETSDPDETLIDDEPQSVAVGAQDDHQRVPLAEDQRSYYERHRPERKRKSPIKQLIAYALGGALALPIAGGILLAIGRAPNLGFWPFDGSFNQQSITMVAGDPGPVSNSGSMAVNNLGTQSQNGSPSGQLISPDNEELNNVAQDALVPGTPNGDSSAEDSLSASDVGSQLETGPTGSGPGASDDRNALPSEKNTDDSGSGLTIDLDNLVSDEPSKTNNLELPSDEKMPGELAPNTTGSVVSQNNDSASAENNLDADINAVENEDANPGNANPANSNPANSNPANSANGERRAQSNLNDMLLVFPEKAPDPPPVDPTPQPVNVADAGNEKSPPVNTQAQDEIGNSDLANMERPSLLDEPAPTIEAAKPALNSDVEIEPVGSDQKVADSPRSDENSPRSDKNSQRSDEKSQPSAPRTAEVAAARPSPPSEPPQVTKICTAALNSLDALQQNPTPELKTVAQTFVVVSRVGELARVGSGPSLVAVRNRLADLRELDDFGDFASAWLKRPNRQTDGIVLVGKPGANLSGQTIQLADGTVVNVLLPGNRPLPAIKEIVAIGLIEGSGSEQKVRLVAAIPRK